MIEDAIVVEKPEEQRGCYALVTIAERYVQFLHTPCFSPTLLLWTHYWCGELLQSCLFETTLPSGLASATLCHSPSEHLSVSVHLLSGIWLIVRIIWTAVAQSVWGSCASSPKCGRRQSLHTCICSLWHPAEHGSAHCLSPGCHQCRMPSSRA